MADFRRLPNLTALRAFEAAARHQNFSRAADEIHVTHGAISHQVRALEAELGVQLFTRAGKRIALTEHGQQFAIALRRSLLDIAIATDVVKAATGHRRLTISSLSSFAARWLSPRLGNFIEQFPDIEVRLQSSTYLTDFAREDVDVAIRFGQGNYPGLAEEWVMDDYYYPVASPHFNGGKLPATPQDLVRSALLRCDLEPWMPWFKAANVALPEPTAGIIFQDSTMLVRAAIDGQGIALTRHGMVSSDVASGALVRLFDVTVKCPSSYYFVCPPASLQKSQVKAFRDWLFCEVAKWKAADSGQLHPSAAAAPP
ncbi:LysR family glycine cleavage system transcriptional activator [Actimicrobium sp. GrIS 1.19]|uniref:transcriptional regulator GcvA n=1 Tax=Actimicrobium sp. GrIS 1.19 TaxID=3071708 RepID=UPI002DFFD4DB|nr:LysR family glycine cleavage system transcriptional activator [Actimicrobium sp. GrIS 1.19]